MIIRTRNKIQIVKEPAVLTMPREMYSKTSGMGANRKEMTADKKLLKWAEQFRPLRINGRAVHQSYCAYGGLRMPVKVSADTGFGNDNSSDEKKSWKKMETGFSGMPGEVVGHVDHKVPNGHGGEDDCWNYQLLSSFYNLSPMKGERKTLHVVAEAYRRGGTIEGRSFEPMWDLFIWNFDRFHDGDGKITDIEMIRWWPWWLRKTDPPHRPYLPGYDEKRREMFVSPEESLKMEFGWLAYNVLLYCKYAPKKFGDDVRETFEREYVCTPEEMIKYARI